MSSQDNKKQRKSIGGSASGSGVAVTVAESSSGAGPAFVNFPSVKPNKKTGFTVFSRDPGSSHDLSKQQTLIAGETEDVEYFSTNRDRQAGEGRDCNYVAGVYDPETNTVHLAPAPLYLLAHRVKRMRVAPTAAVPANTLWKAKRNDLGETFGTRKAKSQIRAEERNKVDISAMAGVKANLIDSIGGIEATEGPAGPSEFIPKPNTETKVVSEVYPRSSIIPDAEWSAIDVRAISAAADDRARSDLLPYKRSRWVENKMRVAVEGPSHTRKNSLRMLYYLACLLGFYDKAGALSKKSMSEIPALFPGIPQAVLQGLLQRFAEPNGKRYTVTDTTKVKLMTWICTCYLACDGWSVDIGKVAQELKLTPTKVTDVFRSLGCSVDLPTAAEREKMGLSASEASKNRRAVLKAPVKFPNIKRRGPAKRG